jgi:predicted phosphodiesterase
MIAILSDVHANLEALLEVCKDLKARKVKSVLFLGDLVGYGPSPRECLEVVQRFEFCLLGNHDRAVVQGIPNNFNKIARHAALWTRDQLDPESMRLKSLRKAEYRRRQEAWDFLQRLKPSGVSHGWFCAHDNPINPGDDKYVQKQTVARQGFDANPDVRAFFIGHSHVPVIYTYDERIKPEPGRSYPFDRRCIVNVGSVGQPRDKDPRACYLLLEQDSFRFMRLPYDYAVTQKKIRQAGMDPSLADRLAEGR